PARVGPGVVSSWPLSSSRGRRPPPAGRAKTATPELDVISTPHRPPPPTPPAAGVAGDSTSPPPAPTSLRGHGDVEPDEAAPHHEPATPREGAGPGPGRGRPGARADRDRRCSAARGRPTPGRPAAHPATS